MKNQLSRSKAGETLIRHKGKLIPTSVGNRNYEALYNSDLRFDSNLALGNISMSYEHRPDLIANLFFDGPDNWWKVCEINNIFDVFEQLDKGEAILLPV